jgi:hypothetical protein
MVDILTWSLFQKSKEKKLAKMSHATVPFTIVHCKDTVPKNSKQIFLDMKLRGLVPNSYIHVPVSGLYLPTTGPPVFLQQNRWTDPGNI